MKEIPNKLRLYTGMIIIIGIFCVFWGSRNIISDFDSRILFFIVIGIITESLDIRIKKNIAISISFTIGLASVLVFQSYIVAVIGFSTMLLYVEIVDGKIYHLFNSDLYKRIFNGCAYAISLATASMAYNMFDVRYTGMRMQDFSIVGIVVALLMYTIVNLNIFTTLMCILGNIKWKEAFHENKWTIINITALSPLGVITAVAYNSYGWFAVVLFLVPLLLARYSFKLYIDMRHVYFETIKALSNAMEAKDEYTKGHSYRVAEYAAGIAKEMKMSHDKIDKINTAAILHDIGKIGIADIILNKPGQLEDDEFLQIQKHPEIGAKILGEVDFLKEVAEIIKHHHERYDGKGYPDKLCGDAIPLEACVLAVADAYDAMTSNRPYRKATDSNRALRIIINESGRQFHPLVVKKFATYMERESQKGKVTYVS
ncbi:metal dependent phosphohydrolase [Alkaliphilus metalliredigens QYMF]|uniref:Metal dependent phosphohydrolase n=2 Tax=Alkaliphilus TaxID=114627 RepID=A6TUF2_ALKMQ|nr:metal dependent phosphohydrolase [Alkaliphilus metalliredigens QYMF]